MTTSESFASLGTVDDGTHARSARGRTALGSGVGWTAVVAMLCVTTGGGTGCTRLDDVWLAATGAHESADAGVPYGRTVPDRAPAVHGDDAAVPYAPDDHRERVATDAGTPRDVNDAGAVTDNRPTVTALAVRTGIVEGPTSGARWIGYLRAGGTLPIVRGPVGNDGCPARRDTPGAGWYEVAGGGYVCVGNLAGLTAQVADRVFVRRLPIPPDVDASLPFVYATNYRPTVMYRWLPSIEDEREVEPERFAPRAPRTPEVPTASDAGVAEAPDGGDAGVRLEDLTGVAGSPLLRRMTRGMWVSLDRSMRGAGDSFWHTQSGGYVRAGMLSPLRTPPTYQGVVLDATHHLPVAISISTAAHTYVVNGRSASVVGEPIPRLTVYFLAEGPAVTVRGEEYYRTVEGVWLRSRQVRVITRQEPPVDLGVGEKWIDVNLDHESVVAYVGTEPVYVTVASTGRRNRTDPDANYETIQGGFRIQSKHVATTMDGNSANDGPYSIDDVPWVMYFEQSFALHGAFWHNQYGMMHSHGCVNLAPADAHWLFGWTEPMVPAGWHGVYATPTHPGTRVYVHYDNQPLGERGGPEHPPTH